MKAFKIVTLSPEPVDPAYPTRLCSNDRAALIAGWIAVHQCAARRKTQLIATEVRLIVMGYQEFNARRRKALPLLAEEVKSFYNARFPDEAQFLKLKHNNVSVRLTSSRTDLIQRIDLYLRIEGMKDGRVKLVIARIALSEQRAGHGTALVAHLAQIAPRLGFECIEIESVNDESRAFAIRLGMQEHEQDCYIADVPLLQKIASK